ncbi:hypothetical protein K402DRAFT_447827 [Aulographum hederae CBS 113979]|uniref:Anaphase-promoting complex subunit 1 beta-sandwich domain-containing protein n=1 Tax=Aulographum hederae CBS 113979 TaxID=1176131 RepID=A0A6G1GSZ7_9PEZI|nr:hypothetical protein K402DRAFT_447827 [Aulographum hederae CBS 113979]
MVRTFALATGQAMVHFNIREPLSTEKFGINGYSLSCHVMPMDISVSADRTVFTEDKYGWAFFHVGVAAGLSISKNAQNIDNSWIVYNKPNNLSNRHAGFILGLGLNGHLRSVAKWLAFKYLTPKHTMSSIGLLLGLSVSYLGTMNALVTRLLSVHVTRLLPPGAAELNLSPLTQTTGLMGIGMLYHGTQHRRMSEVMLSEVEYCPKEIQDDAPPDNLRTESYRLAAGFALGLINLGKGNDLGGLRDMNMFNRLLHMATGVKRVELTHILDRATAGATIAIALIFMKTEDKVIARKIDIPDATPQFEYVRPDILLLRTMAKHLIMWNDIQATGEWVARNLPEEYMSEYTMRDIDRLSSSSLYFFNIMAGLLWAVGLRFAGTGDTPARDFLITYLDQFVRIAALPALQYDAKLTRTSVRTCQHLVALAAATVMAGTGDLEVFRRLRLLHNRIGPDATYGGHMATHMALGALFMGSGTITFGTSNLAIASLICAFYPQFPKDSADNRAHLQAFRHFWVLATESRCMVVRDAHTHRALSMPISIHLKTGEKLQRTAPCLLPEFETVARVVTEGLEYWPVALDFVENTQHLESFRENQSILVVKREGRLGSGAQTPTQVLPEDVWLARSLSALGRDVLEGEETSLQARQKKRVGLEGAEVEARRILKAMAASANVDHLRGMRVLFAWADRARASGDGRVVWLGEGFVRVLKKVIADRRMGGRVADVGEIKVEEEL